MLPVEIVPVDGSTLVLRARGSELLILTDHIRELKSKKDAKAFTQYFMTHALLNRPARKLFEAWLRKDKSLWQRVYKAVQTEMKNVDESAPAKKPASTPAKDSKSSAKVTEPAKEVKKSQPAEKKPQEAEAKKAEKSDSKTTKKKAAKKSVTKKKSTTKKTETTKKKTTVKKKSSSNKKTTKKSTKKKTSKPAAKKTTAKKTTKKKTVKKAKKTTKK